MNLFLDGIKILVIIKYGIFKIGFFKYLFDMCYVLGILLDIVGMVMKGLGFI